MGNVKITCKKLSKLIRAYSDGELNISTEVAIEFHARHCDSCSRELALQSALIKGLRSGRSHRAPSGFESRALNRITKAKPGMKSPPKRWYFPNMGPALGAFTLLLLLGMGLSLPRNSKDEMVKRTLPINTKPEAPLTNVNELAIRDPLVVSVDELNFKGSVIGSIDNGFSGDKLKNVSIGPELTPPPSKLIIQEDQQLLATVSNIPKPMKSFVPKAFDAKAFWNEGHIVDNTNKNAGNKSGRIHVKMEMSRELSLDEDIEKLLPDPNVEFYRSITEDADKDTEEETLSKTSILKKT